MVVAGRPGRRTGRRDLEVRTQRRSTLRSGRTPWSSPVGGSRPHRGGGPGPRSFFRGGTTCGGLRRKTGISALVLGATLGLFSCGGRTTPAAPPGLLGPDGGGGVPFRRRSSRNQAIPAAAAKERTAVRMRDRGRSFPPATVAPSAATVTLTPPLARFPGPSGARPNIVRLPAGEFTLALHPSGPPAIAQLVP